MKTAVFSNRFKKDLKRCQKRGLQLDKIEHIIQFLIEEKELPAKHRPHFLSGNWSGCSECHIEPDWLLIYQDTEDEVYFLRTGTHSDLF